MSGASEKTVRPSGVPLPELGEGHAGVVAEIQGGRGIVLRLAELGIRAGARLTVIRGKGPMIVSLKGHRLVIGHGMVQRILVEPERPAREGRR